MEAPSLEARRCYLAAAIAWAIVDPVAAHCDQLLQKQRDALRLLEPLEATIGGLQLDSVSEELCNNVCAALLPTGNLARARAIAVAGLAPHPNLAGLLRIRANELADKEDFIGPRQLTDGRYNELPTSTLATLAEVSANKGDLGWHQVVMTLLDTREHTAQQTAELQALTSHALWEAGDKRKALQLSKDLSAEFPNHVLTYVMLARRLMQIGEPVPAAAQVDLAVAVLQPDSPTSDVLYVADLLYDRNLYPEAAALYERVVQSPAGIGLSQRLLACLIESGRRRKAREVLETLSPEVRGAPSFRRIESNLADHPSKSRAMRNELAECHASSLSSFGHQALAQNYRFGAGGTTVCCWPGASIGCRARQLTVELR